MICQRTPSSRSCGTSPAPGTSWAGLLAVLGPSLPATGQHNHTIPQNPSALTDRLKYMQDLVPVLEAKGGKAKQSILSNSDSTTGLFCTGPAESALAWAALERAQCDAGRPPERLPCWAAAAGLWPGCGMEPDQAHGRASHRGAPGDAGAINKQPKENGFQL